MAQRVQSTSAYEVMIRYIVSVWATLLAIPRLGHLAPAWEARIREFQGHRDARDAVIFAWIQAIANYRVADLEWDTQVGDLSSEAHHAAGDDANAEPYEPLFGTVKATEAKSFGPAKAVKLGTRLVATLEALDHPKLRDLLPRLKAANEALKVAGEARDAAFEQVLLQNIVRVKRLRALEEERVNTELDILTLFKGRHDLVKVVLGGGGVAELRSIDALDAPANPEEA